VMVHEQPGGRDTQVLAGEAGRGEKRMAQGADQGLDPGIAEAQRRGPPSRTQTEGPTRQTPSAGDRARRAGEGDYGPSCLASRFGVGELVYFPRCSAMPISLAQGSRTGQARCGGELRRRCGCRTVRGRPLSRPAGS
jgi:hypothetical protein